MNDVIPTTIEGIRDALISHKVATNEKLHIMEEKCCPQKVYNFVFNFN